MSKKLPLQDATGRPFVYSVPDQLFNLLHQTDSDARGHIARYNRKLWIWSGMKKAA